MHKRNGFTLIELLLVIVIIIIITGISISIGSGYVVERSIYSVATQIQQDLLLIQNLSITHSTETDFKITFNADKKTYVYEKSEDGANKVNRNLNSGISIYDLRVDGSSKNLPLSFNFDDQGRLHETGNSNNCRLEIYIENNNKSKQVMIEVSVVGRVRIEWINR